MKAIIMVVLVPLAIICLGAFLFAGIKALFRRIGANFAGWFTGKKKSVPPEAMMDIVTLTSGTCQSCGKTFIGTTEDKKPPLQTVSLMGESRVLCNDCLQNLIREFSKTSASHEKHYSESALKLKQLLQGVNNAKKS